MLLAVTPDSVATLTWPQIGGLITMALFLMALIAAVTGWAVRINAGERADTSAKRSHERIDSLNTEISDLKVKNATDIAAAKAEAASALALFREKVAQDYATRMNLNQVETRIIDELSKSTTEVRRLSDRLDRLLERGDQIPTM